LKPGIRLGLLKDIAVTYSGTVIGSGIGFLIQIYLQKSLGPADYGILALATSAGSLATVLTDAGLSDAMIRFAGKYRRADPERAMTHCTAALLARLVLVALVTTVGYLAARWIAVDLYEEPDLAAPLAWVFLGMAGGALYGYWTYFIQAYERFMVRSTVNVTLALIRLAAVAGVSAAALLTPTSMVVLDAAVNFTGFLIGLAFSPRGVLRPSGIGLDAASRDALLESWRELIPYCRFTGILIIGDTVFNETDTLMLGHFVNADEVGIYRVAWTYATLVTFLNIAAGSVIFPKVSQLSDRGDIGRFLREAAPILLTLAALTVPYAVAVHFWLPWYDSRYALAVPLFYLLYLGLVADLFAGSLSLALFSLDRPGVLTWVSLLKIALNIGGNVALIPVYGVFGAALATLMTRILGGIVYLAALHGSLQRG